MTNTMQWVLAMTMAGGTMANAQQVMIVEPVPAISAVVLQAKVSPVITVPGLQLQVTPGLQLQIKSSGTSMKDDLFAGTEKFASGASEVTEINLDPSTMGMVGKDKGRDGEMARKMKAMVIHTYKYDHPGMYRQEDFDTYRKKVEDGSWNCSIRVRSKSGSTDICSRTAADHVTNEMVILTAEPQKLTFIHMSGQMSLEELDDMSGSATGLTRRVEPLMPKYRPERPAPAPAPVPPTPPTPPSQ